MENGFEVVDKSGRKIRLTNKQWKHVLSKRPYMSNYLEEINHILKNPIKIVAREVGNIFDYYGYFKNIREKSKYLKIAVKYLNGDGFVITVYFVRNIN